MRREEERRLASLKEGKMFLRGRGAACDLPEMGWLGG